jgi:predicted HTH domain antitoxin
MRQAIGIRLPKEVLRQIERLSKEEMEDRSTVIRKLVLIGYKNFIQKKTAEEYLKGSITLSEAAHLAGLTIWEMEKYLVEHGFKSSYSIEDLEREMKILKK